MEGIVLVQPKNSKHDVAYAPLGLLSLAAWLRDKYYVRIIDLRYDDEAVLWDAIYVGKPLAVGFSVLTGEGIKDVVRICKRIKERFPDVATVLGGVHPTILPEQTLENPYVDWIVTGDGEEALKELMWLVKKGTRGIDHIRRGKKVDLDKLPFPAWHLIDVERYNKRIGGLNIYTSKGCPFPCTFCHNTIHNPKWRGMSAERVVRDVKRLKYTYGIEHFIIHDDNFVVDKKRALDIAEGLEELGVSWSINIRIDSISEEFLRGLMKGGLNEVRIGCESGNDRVLTKVVRKSIHSRDIVQAVHTCSRLRLRTLLSFVIGWPTETRDERQSTISLVQLLCNSCRKVSVYPLWIYNPYPGTSLFKKAIDLGFMSPRTLEEWGEFNWGTAHIPWIDKPEEYELIHKMSRVAHYNRRNPIRVLFRWITKWRMRHNYWKWGLDVRFILWCMRVYQGWKAHS